MRISLIVAVAQNGVIGSKNALPWHLPEDLQYFKRITMGKPLIMGRKTHESIGRVLPGRLNVVVSRQPHENSENLCFVTSLDEALSVAQAAAAKEGQSEVIVMGGAEIYQQALPNVERIYRTLVYVEAEGDAFFAIPKDEWIISCEVVAASKIYRYAFQILERRV